MIHFSLNEKNVNKFTILCNVTAVFQQYMQTMALIFITFYFVVSGKCDYIQPAQFFQIANVVNVKVVCITINQIAYQGKYTYNIL